MTVGTWLYLSFYSPISQAYTAKNAYKWLVRSHLIDSHERIKENDVSEERNVFSQLETENGIIITEYSYNVEKERKKEEKRRELERKSGSYFQTDPVGYHEGVVISVKNISIRIPDGSGNPVDFENALKTKKVLPLWKKTYASPKGKTAVENIDKNAPFSTIVDSFDEIESQILARETFDYYLKNREVTWSGRVIGSDEEGRLYIHGKPSIYKGQLVSDVERPYQNKDHSMTKYVFAVRLKKEDSLASLKPGDEVTVKGQISYYQYQNKENNWFLSNAFIVKHKKTNQPFAEFNPNDVHIWFNQTSLGMFNSNRYETVEKNKKVTHIETLFFTITAYSYDREKEIGTSKVFEKNGGKEFTYKNINVWVPYGVENIEAFKDILKAKGVDKMNERKFRSTSKEMQRVRQVAEGTEEKMYFSFVVTPFYDLRSSEKDIVFNTYMLEKTTDWEGKLVSMTPNQLVLYGGTESYQNQSIEELKSNPTTRPYLFIAKLKEGQQIERLKQGDTVKVTGVITTYSNESSTSMWTLSESVINK